MIASESDILQQHPDGPMDNLFQPGKDKQIHPHKAVMLLHVLQDMLRVLEKALRLSLSQKGFL